MSRKGFGRILGTILALTMLLSLFPASAAGPEPADSVYRNGKIYTVNEDFTVVSAIAVKGDRLVYVGDEAGVIAALGPGQLHAEVAVVAALRLALSGHVPLPGGAGGKDLLQQFYRPRQGQPVLKVSSYSVRQHPCHCWCRLRPG